MLATLTTAGSSGAVDPDRVRAQRAGDPAGDDRLLLAVLGRAEQLLAEVVVDGRVGRAADRAGERDGRRAQPLAAHEQLRRGGHERAVAAAGAEHEAGAEGGAQHPEGRGRVVRRGRVDGDLAGEHDLLERARADALDGAGDRLLVVLGRGDARDPEAAGGRGIEQRQRPLAQPGGARRDAVRELLGHVVGRGERRQREADLAVAARQRDLGDDQLAGAEARPVRRGAALGREREAADRHEARCRPGRRASRPPRAPASARQAAATSAKRPGPDASSRRTAPSAASAAPPRSGCSKQNQSSPGRRDAKATALGSTAASTTTVRPTSTSSPLAARAADGALAAAAQLGARLGVERERVAGGRGAGAHRANQSRSAPQ